MPRIGEETRGKVIELARSGLARNEVARQAGIGQASVSRICAEAGVTFARTQTRQATEAKRVDLHAARVQRAGDLLDDLQSARGWLTVAEDARELRDAAQAIKSLAEAHARLVLVPNSQADVEEQKSMLGDLFHGLRLVRDQMDQEAS